MSVKSLLILSVAILFIACPVSASIKSCIGIGSCIMNQTPNQTAGINGINGTTSHNLLLNLTSDDHPQYPNVSGRAGGQTIQGGTTTGNLTLNGSGNNGNLLLQPGFNNIGIGLGTANIKSSSGGTYKVIEFPRNMIMYRQSTGDMYITSNEYWVSGVGFKRMSATAASILEVWNGGMYFYTAPTGAADSDITNTIVFTINGTNMGVGTTTPTSLFDNVGSTRFRNCSGTPLMDAGGNMTCISDEKMKTGIVPYISESSKVASITPKSYKWNSASGFDTTRLNTGFSANEIQQVYPECVIARDDVAYSQTCDKDNNCQTIEKKTGTQTLALDDKCLIAVLWNAVIEQQKDIKDLKEWKQDKVRV